MDSLNGTVHSGQASRTQFPQFLHSKLTNIVGHQNQQKKMFSSLTLLQCHYFLPRIYQIVSTNNLEQHLMEHEKKSYIFRLSHVSLLEYLENQKMSCLYQQNLGHLQKINDRFEYHPD